jgi:acetoin utilization deacetylase AcuC-like enzyme
MHRKVYLLHDGRMTLHRPLHLLEEHEYDVTYENPDRILRIHSALRALERRLCTYRPWDNRFLKLECIAVDRQTVQLVHSAEHYDKLYQTQFLSDEELMKLTEKEEDLYYNRYTFEAASLACGGVVQCVEHVTSNFRETTRAIALVRPPGHHAVRDSAMGEEPLLLSLPRVAIMCDSTNH